MIDFAGPVAAPLPPHYNAYPEEPPSPHRYSHYSPLPLRTGSKHCPRPSSLEFTSIQPLAGPSSPTSIRTQFRGSPIQPPSPQSPTFSNAFLQEPIYPLRRRSTQSSNSSSIHLFQGPPPLCIPSQFISHRHNKSASSSISSLHRNPSKDSQGSDSTLPDLQVPSNSVAIGEGYVAGLRKAYGTVWSATGQIEDPEEDNQKEEKTKKFSKTRASTKVFSY
jgi:hypothetical protein